MLPASYWITGLITAIVVIICVLTHYEGLRFLSDRLPTPRRHYRRRIVVLILSLLFMHVIIVPIGPIRTMSGTEGITGLVMITWSASFALMEMLKNWNEGD